MKMQLYIAILFLVAANRFYSSKALDCTGLPSQSVVNLALQNEVASAGGEGGSFSIKGGPYYTCQVQGTTMGTYQELSIIMEYTSGGTDRVGQFEMTCGNGNIWSRVQDSLILISFGSYDGSIGLRTDCSSCTNMDNPNNDNNCQACNSACSTDGLMRCTGAGAGDCCLVFEDNGDCSPDLNCNKNNFIANAQNNFTCTCGLSSCSDGYAFNSTSCTCYLTDICLADNPCDNNGSCTLDTTPHQYTCNCTDNYSGTNCTELISPVVTSSVVPVMGGSTSSLAPTATPTPSPITCVDNCNVCLNASCCMECTSNYTTISDDCTCVLLSSLPCPMSNCAVCPRPDCCDQCEDGFTNARDDRCQCVEIAVSPSSTTQQPSRPTSTSTTDPPRTEELRTTDVAVIIPSIILGILVLIVLIVLIIYLVYYFVNQSSIAAAKAKLAKAGVFTEAHDNPTYIAPEIFDVDT